MSENLLKTKLHIPQTRSAELIPRPRLFEQLNEGVCRQLTLVAAPAGSGKTTLVSDWLREIDGSAAWLSLDQADNDLTRFWTYLIAGLQTVQPGLGQMALAALQNLGFGNVDTASLVENLLTNLINDIATLNGQLILVLDDYHLIEALEIHQSLNFLLTHLPASLQLVLITREDPPLPLARLRVKKQMIEIRTRDLQFTTEEATQFLNQVMGLDLSQSSIRALEQRTEGWVAGLQMAALSMQQVPDEAAFVEAFAGDDRYIVDYLISEVVERQPISIQTFLLKTSLLDQFNVSLCNAVTEQDNGRNNLDYLERTNLFLISLDNKREWYRYHSLFRDLLRYRFVDEVGEDGVKQLHQRAAVWYAGHSRFDEAIQHYLAAEDFGQAAYLMEQVSVKLIGQGQLRKVCRWLDALPVGFLRTRPLLCVSHALALNLSGQAAAVTPRLQDAEKSLSSAPPTQHQDIQALIHFVQAFLARRENNMSLSTEFLRRAAKGLSQDNLAVRASVNLNLGFNYYLTGQLPQADQTLQSARVDGQASEAIYVTLIATATQANTYVAQGKLNQAMTLYEEAIAYGLTHNEGRPFPPAGYAYAGLGQVVLEQNDLERAEQCLTQAVELGELMSDWSMTRRGLLPLAWLRQMQGDHAAAQTLWQRALSVVQQAESKRIEAQLRVHQARLWLAQAATSADEPVLTAATAWAEAYQQSKPDPAGYSQALPQLTLAWLRLLQGKPDEALVGLEPVVETAIAGGHTDNLIKILALQALAHVALDGHERALATLEQSFELAAPENYVRTFIDLGPPMQKLLQQAISHHISPDYVAILLNAFPSFPSTPSAPPLTPQPLIEPLSERELQILRLLANGLSNQEIADSLIISVNTVRTHLRRIYGKLAVKNRTTAVSQAQELGLL